MNNILKRTISGVVIILIFAGSILLSEYSMLGLLLLIYSFGLYEFKNMFLIKRTVLFLATLVAGQLFIIFNYLWATGIVSTGAYPILIIGMLSTIILYYLLINETSIRLIGKMLFAGIWLSISLSFYMALGWTENPDTYRPHLLLIVICLIWVNDVGAYLIGSLMGKNLLAPRISPGKTWEGFIGGTILNSIAGYFIYIITDDYSALFWMIMGMIVSLGATVGDLFESKLKREARVKDAGKMIPGHGGVLDRFDSLLFTGPIFYLILLIWDKL